MSELNFRVVSRLSVSLRSTSSVSPTASLPPLGSPPDGKFLDYTSTSAGRAVLIELYAPKGATRDARERAWQIKVNSVDVEKLGRAAQILERAGINWRRARNFKMIFAAVRALPQGSIS